MSYLLLTVQFIDDRYHGLLDRNGPPEWPPSPFRLFCAIVAGVARRGELESDIGKALMWLQTFDPPVIIAPRHRIGRTIKRYVPNNDGDNPKKFDRQNRLAEKSTIPTLMLLDENEKPTVYYVWEIGDNADIPLELVRDAARSLIAFGWGIDMAFADARKVTQTELESLPGVRWYPKPGLRRDEGMLRTPVFDKETKLNSLNNLKHCYKTAINRIEHGKPLRSMDKPQIFNKIFYDSIERPIGRPSVVFELRHDDGSLCSYPQRQLIKIAGMVRHLAKELMLQSPPSGTDADWVERYVVGHRKKDDSCHRQFSYLPLPSIGHQNADQLVRRVMITAPAGDDAWLEHLAKRLASHRLKPEHPGAFGVKGPPTLVRIQRDKMAMYYTNANHKWASVTPVVLPGHDDRKPAKTRRLIEAALAQSGIEQPCEFEWSPFSHFRKSLSAHKYDKNKQPTGYIRPDHLMTLTAVHLKLRFNNELNISGPLSIGAGRHCGLGIFAGVAG